MEIQGTPAPRARVLKVLRFDGAFGAEGCGGGFAAMSINAASRRAAVSLFFFPWAVALHIFGNTSRRLVCSIIPLLTILTEILRLRLSILVICQVFFLKKFIVFS